MGTEAKPANQTIQRKSRMNRRYFLKGMGLGADSVAILGCMNAVNKCAVKASVERPNVLFCISDDQSWLHKLINGDKADGIRRTIVPATSRTF
jgi:hypothetical protein